MFTGAIQFAHAQSEKVQAYINRFKNIAIAEELRTGVPASITLAQGIIETQAGESDLVKRSNNHFGIKCKNDWAGEKVYHDDDAKGECFRSYADPEESYKDHSDFLKNRKHYAFLFQLDPTDYEGWAKGLKKAGYATNPAYANMLIKTIVENNLHQYTLMAMELKKQQQENVFTVKNENSTETTSMSEEIAMAKIRQKNEGPSVSNTSLKSVAEPTAESAESNIFSIEVPVEKINYPAGVFSINNTSVIFANAGTSLLALANQFNLTYQKLLEFNELEQIDILEKDQLLYLEKKMKKGSRDFVVVAPNETLYDIAQKEGVRLESILTYNKIPKGKQPAAGEKIYLKAEAPVAPKLISNNNNTTAFINN